MGWNWRKLLGSSSSPGMTERDFDRQHAQPGIRYQHMDVIFAKLLNRHLLNVCEECGDGDESHPVNKETGECYRHGGWSPSAAKEAIRKILRDRDT
jgi:hypothetical protein